MVDISLNGGISLHPSDNLITLFPSIPKGLSSLSMTVSYTRKKLATVTATRAPNKDNVIYIDSVVHRMNGESGTEINGDVLFSRYWQQLVSHQKSFHSISFPFLWFTSFKDSIVLSERYCCFKGLCFFGFDKMIAGNVKSADWAIFEESIWVLMPLFDFSASVLFLLFLKAWREARSMWLVWYKFLIHLPASNVIKGLTWRYGV